MFRILWLSDDPWREFVNQLPAWAQGVHLIVIPARSRSKCAKWQAVTASTFGSNLKLPHLDGLATVGDRAVTARAGRDLSNGPGVKVRGTASNIAEKYQQLARDAHTSGDLVAAEAHFRNLAFGPLGGQGFLLVDFCSFLVRCSSRCVRESRIISRQTTSST